MNNVMFQRILKSKIESTLNQQKVTLLLGARRVGKTELLKQIYKERKKDTLWLNAEDKTTADLLEERSIANYSRLLEDSKLLIIDEAQYIPDISQKAKLMIDSVEPLHIILTGSSAFHLFQMGAPLMGRTITYQLYPLAQLEWQQKEDLLQSHQNLETKLIYGAYPEVASYSKSADKGKYLNELANTYLLKDILEFEQIRNAKRIRDLLQLLAYQIGSEVSLNELGRKLELNKNTISRYLELLEKSFIIFSLSGFSKNLRKEVSKNKKWYFYDNGVRNALIGDFRPLAVRNDVGYLWEQYFINERIKFNAYKDKIVRPYFWRTYDQQEIDLIELENANIHAYECKWKGKNVKIPAGFSKAYPDASFDVVFPKNHLNWIS
jgi:predicted AAA+ superfamily ATPase